MQVRVKENPEEFGTCGCGRSPTGKCIGWHSLTNEDYDKELKKWNSQQLNESAPKFLTEG